MLELLMPTIVVLAAFVVGVFLALVGMVAGAWMANSANSHRSDTDA